MHILKYVFKKVMYKKLEQFTEINIAGVGREWSVRSRHLNIFLGTQDVIVKAQGLRYFLFCFLSLLHAETGMKQITETE